MSLLAKWDSLGFDQPQWLWLWLLAPLVAAVSWGRMGGLEPPRRALCLVVRSLVMLVLIACLAEITRVGRTDDLTVMFLMDRSASVEATQEAQERYLRDACREVPPADRVGVIDFARNAFIEQLPMRGGYHLEPGQLPPMPGKERTDVAAAIRLAMAMFPHDAAKRIVLLSDGNDNLGDVIPEVQRARDSNVAVDVVPLWYRRANEVYIDKMVVPTQAEPGEVVPIRLLLHSEKAAAGTIDLYQNGKKIDLDAASSHVDLQPGNNALVIKLPVSGGATQRYSAVFRPDAEAMDTLVENNRSDAFSFVGARGSVLLISMNPADDARLLEALQGERVPITQVDAAAGLMDLLDLTQYACIILANVPANLFTEEQQKALASYVRDLGGGLIMTGGNEGFGAGGWIGTAVEEVMPVRFEVKHKKVLPRGALVLIMHSCEIPRGNYWGKEVAKKSVDTISSQDYIGVLAYGWSPPGENWEVPLQLAGNKAAIKARIDNMGIGDMPSFDATMDMAVKGFKSIDASQKHLIIISDGDPAPPKSSIITEMQKMGITCSTVGIGYGTHVMEQTLRDIATSTKGRFYACRNPAQLPQIFVKESKIVRRALVVDEPFQPRPLFWDSDLLPGGLSADDLPPLGGLVLTSPKEDPRAQVPLIRQTDDGQDPVLAHWQEGLGKAVAFTSGYWPRWGTAWTKWAGFSKLWAQITRWTMRQEGPADFDTYTSIEGDQGRVVIEALDKDAGYLNLLQFDARVVGPDATPMSLQFTQTAPGHYEASFPVDQSGQYIVSAGVWEGGQSKGVIHTGTSAPFSPEFRELRTNEALLRQIVETSGGRWLSMDSKADQVFSHDLPETTASRAVWDWTLAWVLLPLFLLDVAVRRLASWLAFSICVELVLAVVLLVGLDFIHRGTWGTLGALLLAEVVGWSLRYRWIRPSLEALTHTVAALGQAGERSGRALAQLKTSKERVKETRTGAAADAEVEQDAAAARRGMDVPADRPSPDSATPGISLDAPERAPKESPPGTQATGDTKDVTSRLLRSKRQRREGPDENK